MYPLYWITSKEVFLYVIAMNLGENVLKCIIKDTKLITDNILNRDFDKK